MIPSLTLDATDEPNLPPCSAALWWAIWSQKAHRGESVEQLSGRSCYSAMEKYVLIADAVAGLDLKSEDDLLDIGCAAGFTGSVLARSLKRYVGVDYNHGAVRQFKHSKLAVADARFLPFKDGEFEKSYMASVLLCMNREEGTQALAEMRRVTRTRGFVADTLIGANDGLHERNRITYWDSVEDLAKMLHQVGWSRVEFRRMHRVLSHYAQAVDAVVWP